MVNGKSEEIGWFRRNQSQGAVGYYHRPQGFRLRSGSGMHWEDVGVIRWYHGNLWDEQSNLYQFVIGICYFIALFPSPRSSDVTVHMNGTKTLKKKTHTHRVSRGVIFKHLGEVIIVAPNFGYNFRNHRSVAGILPNREPQLPYHPIYAHIISQRAKKGSKKTAAYVTTGFGAECLWCSPWFSGKKKNAW